ncbi:hypothetical protein Mlute_01844 [Meiothermus luteus]|uniref:DUF5666 domain-containing protein n=1 Tax=Meiothermus luteus TaxID=2026184 RepID=A0A399ER04_9DEIN|nr:DUF5666 domain-containing protein [Meiothermus luteus]RIH84601.1 hypothetical protein Mlute_01844 [Meiothermus luteus]RMH57844.1 MAG: hypothetical protein D6684_02625 [Deinococcota bacterium]
MFDLLKRITLATTLVLLSFGALASPDRYRDDSHGYEEYKRSGYLEVKGRLTQFNPQAGTITVNGKQFVMAANVFYKYGRPRVGDYVEVKARQEQGRWVVYQVELKYR